MTGRGEEGVGVEFVALGEVLCGAGAGWLGQPGLWGGDQGREQVCEVGTEGVVEGGSGNGSVPHLLWGQGSGGQWGAGEAAL